MEQTGAQIFTSKDNKMIIICHNDTALGAMHDNLLALKGEIVKRMSTNQEHEEKEAEKKKELDEEASKEASKEEEKKENA